jgi:predicted transcriptional regulator
MLKVDQVHVLRHKVLVEGRLQRQVAKELGISRLTVKKYLKEAVPIRRDDAEEPSRVGEALSNQLSALSGRPEGLRYPC